MVVLVLIVAVAIVMLVPIVRAAVRAQRSVSSAHLRAPLDPSHYRSPSGRLRFRTPEEADIAAILEIERHPTTMAAHGFDDRSLARNQARLTNPQLFAGYQAGTVIALEAATGRVVGTANLAPHLTKDGTALSLGISIAADCRGLGYGAELTAVTIDAAQAVSLVPIIVGTATSNAAMQAIMTRLGYSPRDSVEKYRSPSGSEFDSYWYECQQAPQLDATAGQ